jgi:hypothetical protein
VQRIYSVRFNSSSPSQIHDERCECDWPSRVRWAITSSVRADCPPKRMLFPFFLSSLHFLSQGVCQGVSAILSIGGWSGSQYFSTAVATDANRTAFAKAILNVTSTYQLDGIQIECALLYFSKVLFTHRSIAGNIPVNKELVATPYPRMTAPTSFCFCKRFVVTHRALPCPLQSRSAPFSAPMVIRCQTSPNLRKSSTISVRSFSPCICLTFF